MLNLFPDRSLPGGDVGPFKETDVASYKDLYFAAQRLLRSCISNNEAAGFIAVGRSESIGVFLWATDSLQNQDLRGSALNSTTLTPGTAPPGAANTSGLLNGSPPAGDVSSTS